MNYGHIIDARMMAVSDGVKPTQLHLGYEEVRDLAENDGINLTGGSPLSGKLGAVSGINVQQAPTNHMRILLGQKDEDDVRYYIF